MNLNIEHEEKVFEKLEQLPDGKNLSVVVYVMINSEVKCNVTKGITKNEHTQFFKKYEGRIKSLEDVGWLEETENGTKLTQKGMRIAGKARSKVIN